MEKPLLAKVLAEKGLSRTEVTVAELIIKGLTNKEAAANLFVSDKTIKFHATNIYRKLGVSSRSLLIVWAAPHLDWTETKSSETAIAP